MRLSTHPAHPVCRMMRDLSGDTANHEVDEAAWFEVKAARNNSSTLMRSGSWTWASKNWPSSDCSRDRLRGFVVADVRNVFSSASLPLTRTTVPLATVARQYFDYIAVMDALDVEIAAEYLVIAATPGLPQVEVAAPADPDGVPCRGRGDARGGGVGRGAPTSAARRVLEVQGRRRGAAGAQRRGAVVLHPGSRRLDIRARPALPYLARQGRPGAPSRDPQRQAREARHRPRAVLDGPADGTSSSGPCASSSTSSSSICAGITTAAGSSLSVLNGNLN